MSDPDTLDRLDAYKPVPYVRKGRPKKPPVQTIPESTLRRLSKGERLALVRARVAGYAQRQQARVDKRAPLQERMREYNRQYYPDYHKLFKQQVQG